MSEVGYLQTKISENKIKLEEIENELFLYKQKISLLERTINDSEQRIRTVYDDTKQIINDINIDDIKKEIKLTAEKDMQKSIKKYLDDIKNISKTSIEKYKIIASSEANELYGRLEVNSGKYIDMVVKVIGEVLIEFHDIFLNKKLIKRPITTVMILHQNIIADDKIHIIDFEKRIVKTHTGKNLVKKYTKKMRLRPDQKSERIQQIKIKPKISDDRVINV